MAHVVVHIDVTPPDLGRDILVAQLTELGYEGFLETETGIDAYVPQADYDAAALQALFEMLREHGIGTGHTTSVQEDRNWNEEWEKNFDPVEVDDLCRIRAPFHALRDGFRQEVVIMPKMSFGTGHHSTTWLMVKLMMEEGVQSPLLDMGCGTSVLAILARKLGAGTVTAIDIDEWAYTNSIENVTMNGAEPVEVLQGDAALLAGRTFSTILANINRNVLLADIPIYSHSIATGGSLFLSGFYRHDLPAIRACAEANGFSMVRSLERQDWIAALFRKL
jgi:ribosomal protein L11 methyltransferase